MSTEERAVIIEEEVGPNTTTHFHRSRCSCFRLPCFAPSAPTKPHHLTLGNNSSSSFWDRVKAGDSEQKWWARPFKAFKKIREWSEIVAGPKWKTFIRRFNRNSHNRHRHHHNAGANGKFQYDPLSYALNFDEGQNGHFGEDDYHNHTSPVEHFPDFSSRFAVSARSSMDLGKGAPAS